jgi:hypothetical protein
MPGFTSLDDLIQEMTVNGNFKRTDWNKATHATGNQAAGIWYSLFHSLGNPTAGVLGAVGTNLAWHGLTDRATGAIPHGGDVYTNGSNTKHILNASIFGAGVAPSVWMLVDMLGWYPVTTVTTTGDQTLINSRTWTVANATNVITLQAGWDIPSYTAVTVSNAGGALPASTPQIAAGTVYYWSRIDATTGKLCASLAAVDAGTFIDFTDDGTGTQTITMSLGRYIDGKGVQAFITPSVAHGTGTPNIRLTYYDTGGASSLTPTTLPISNASAPIGQIEYSGTAAGKYGPFMPLAAGDQGILYVDKFNYDVTHGAGGVANVVLCKPLLTLPITTASVVTERDLLNQLPSLPRVYDGACLAWIEMAGGTITTASQFYGHLDFAWG